MADSPIQLQEQVELTTPVTKAKVVVRGYATGRLKQAISALYLAGVTVESDAAGKTKSVSSVNGLVGQQATNKAIEMLVLSVNGATDGVLDAVLDLPEEDFDFIVDEVNKIQAPLVPKTPTSSTTDSST